MMKNKLKQGRPAIPDVKKRQRVSMTLKPELVNYLEAQSKALKIPASRVAEQMLEYQLNRGRQKNSLYELRLGVSLEDLSEFCRELGISSLSLFGSVLRRDFGSESDVDMLVTFRKGVVKSLLDLGGIHSALARFLGRKVDIVRAEGIKNPIRKKEILKSARLVYQD